MAVTPEPVPPRANPTSPPVSGALPPAAVPQPVHAQTTPNNGGTPPTAPTPQTMPKNLLVPTTGGGWLPLSLDDHPEAKPLPTPSTSAQNPAIVLKPSSTTPPDYTPNNAAVLRATGMLSGPGDARLVQGVWQGLRSSGYLKPNQPPNSPSLVVFLPDDALAGTQRPHFVPIEPNKGYAPKAPLPTRIRVGAAASFSPESGLGGEGSASISSGYSKGLPPEAPGTFSEQTSTTTVSARAGYNGGLFGGGGIARSTTTVLTADDGEPYQQSFRSTEVTAGWSPQGPTATVSHTSGMQGPDPRDRHATTVVAGVQVTGPVAQIKIEKPGGSFQAGFNKFDIFGLPVGSFIAGSWGAYATFLTPDQGNQWSLDMASRSLVFYGKGEGKEALTLGVVGIGPVGAPFAIPGPEAVPQQSIKLPPEVIQAINAREQSMISINHLDRRTAQTFGQTPDVVRAHLFKEASGGVSALRPNGTPKSRQELESDLWNKYREQQKAEVTPLETAVASSDETVAKAAAEKLAALRATALQPIDRLATPVTPVFMPANAAAHVFPRGEIANQTELIKNFTQMTGVSPLQPDGTVKSSEQLNEAVWGWFKKNNDTLVRSLKARAASNDPATAQDGERRLEAVRQVAIIAVGEPKIPTPDELRVLVRKQQQRELREIGGGSEKPWERRTEQNPISYRRPYADRFSIEADHSVTTKNTDGKPTATSRLSLGITTPDADAPLSPQARRTGIPDRPKKTFGVTYEQQIALSSQTPAIVTRHQINQDLKAHETKILQQFHDALATSARQSGSSGSVDQTAANLISNLPIRDISPRGDVTSQQISFRLPGQGSLAVRASHTVDVVTPPNGAPFAIAQIVLETNRSGAARSVATWEHIVPLASDRSPEAGAAAVRAQLYRSIVGEGQSEGILKTAARNGLSAMSSGKPLPEQLAPGFVPLASGQSPQDRAASLVSKNQNKIAEGQPTPSSSTNP